MNASVSFGHGPLCLNVLNIHFTSGWRCKQGEVEGIDIALAPKLFSVALASLEGRDDATTLLQILAKNSRTSWSFLPFSYRYRRACILDW